MTPPSSTSRPSAPSTIETPSQSSPPLPTAPANNSTIWTVQTHNRIAWLILSIQAILAFSSSIFSILSGDVNITIGVSSVMFSFALVTWSVTLVEGSSHWPFLISVFFLPVVTDAGFLVGKSDLDGMMLFLTYGILPIITRSFPWFLLATDTRRALNCDSQESIRILWRFVLWTLPTVFIASGGMVSGHYEEGHYAYYSEGWVAFVAVFQTQVLMIVAFASVVWDITGYTSVPHDWGKFERFEFMAVGNMYGLVAVALCFTTILGVLQRIWAPLDYLLEIYWYCGPMVELLVMWQVVRGVLEKEVEDVEDADLRTVT